MKVAISSSGAELSSSIDPRFGRCSYLVFYDTDTNEWEAIANANMAVSGGAGIRTAQMVLDERASAVITGNVGPNAMEVLLAGQVPVYTGISGSVASAVDLFKKGGLTPATGATAVEHAGMRGVMGMGGGGRRGKGRGPW